VSYDDGDSGLIGVGGVSVSLSGGEYIFVYNITTLEDGPFKFLENVPVGNCVLNVYADGFDDYFKSIVVKDGKNTVVDIILSFEETGVISGSVVDSETKSAIIGANATATFSGSAYTFEGSAVTDDDGEFDISQLPVGTYTLNVSTIGYENYAAGGIAVTAGGINDIGVITLSTP
jgi:hypothetical protein